MGEIVRHEWTAFTREQFLSWLSRGYTVSAAAEAISFSRSYVYILRERDEEFRQQWDDAVEQGKDYLEDEARRRAVEGVRKPVFYQGSICGEIQEYSDTLLLAMLKAKKPEYRDKVDVNANLQVSITKVLEEARTRAALPPE